MTAIKGLRERAGLTQAQLAEKMGASQSAVALWETGARMPRSNKLQKLAEVLECTVADLFDNAKA